jgi:hypothetical protein
LSSKNPALDVDKQKERCALGEVEESLFVPGRRLLKIARPENMTIVTNIMVFEITFR